MNYFVSRVLMISLLAMLLAGCTGSQEEQGSQEESTTAPATTEESTAASAADDATSQVVAATEGFLATLDDAQREQASFDFDDELKESNWSNLPAPLVERSDVPFGDMTEEQQQAAMRSSRRR